jgi:hypothetical protein
MRLQIPYRTLGQKVAAGEEALFPHFIFFSKTDAHRLASLALL